MRDSNIQRSNIVTWRAVAEVQDQELRGRISKAAVGMSLFPAVGIMGCKGQHCPAIPRCQGLDDRW